jgi:uncharacterized membrane protein YkoI
MQRTTLSLFSAAFLAVAGLGLGGAYPHAQADEGPAAARRLSNAGTILPLERIVASARAIKPGEVLETELERKGNRYFYEVEILDARGQVWEVTLDASSGKLITLESED